MKRSRLEIRGGRDRQAAVDPEVRSVRNREGQHSELLELLEAGGLGDGLPIGPAARFLIDDWDQIFSAEVTAAIQTYGIELLHPAYRASGLRHAKRSSGASASLQRFARSRRLV